MTTARPRPFILLDALILIAATAAGFALTRSLADVQNFTSMDAINLWTDPENTFGRNAANATYYTTLYGRDVSRHWYGFVVFWTQRLAFWPCPCLIAWTSALVIIALVPTRRPPRRRLARPGVMACLTGTAAFAALATVFPQTLIGYPNPAAGWTVYRQQWWAATCFASPRTVALAVSTAWLTLALSRRWRPDRGWLDRLGRFLGTCWIFLGILRVLSSWMAVFIR